MLGRVLWFDCHKNYGFIETEHGDEIFFHWNDVIKNEKSYQIELIVKGTPVQFDMDFGSTVSGSNKAVNVIQLPRKSIRNKPLLTVAFMLFDEYTDLNALVGYLTSKSHYGVKWIRQYENVVMAFDQLIDPDLINYVGSVIQNSNAVKRGVVFEAHRVYDILFI